MSAQQIVLITGVSRGFGFELARAFTTQGFRVLGVVRSVDSKQKIEQQLPNIKLLVSDVTAADYESNLTSFITNETINLVINNVGSGSNGKTLELSTVEQLQREFNTHCVAAMITAKVCYAKLLETKGQILNISSRRGSLTMQADGAAIDAGCSYSYRIGKAAQNMLTLCMADEFDRSGVRVSAVHPGRLLTKLGASDACFSPEVAAQRLVDRVVRNSIHHRQFINLEGEDLPW